MKIIIILACIACLRTAELRAVILVIPPSLYKLMKTDDEQDVRCRTNVMIQNIR
jgi:hypothetical protein